jgi:(E)-2-((N-methylformamido)methylene)succinate hydrolase
LSGGGATNYRIEGDGPPVTLIHGVGSYLESWDGVIAAVGDGYRFLRYDLRGHGESPKLPGPYSLDDFVDDLCALLDSQDIDRTHLAGFSLGGLIAQAFALAHPDRLQSLTLISTVAGRTDAEKTAVRRRAETLAEKGAGTHLIEAVDRWFTAEFIAARPEVLEERRRRSLNNDPDCYAAAYRVLAEYDLTDRLPEIKTPTLVMTGENDVGSTPRMAELIADRVPDSRLHIFPRLKHSVLLEAPDQVAAQMKPFLETA